jgi:hypothetical protein
MAETSGNNIIYQFRYDLIGVLDARLDGLV